MRARIGSCVTGAAVALVVSLIAFGGPPSADAADGDSVIAGQDNFETSVTRLHNTDLDGTWGLVVVNDGTASQAIGIEGYVSGQSGRGVFGLAGQTGVEGAALVTGVLGESTGQGDGVDGQANNACCSGVFGTNDGTGNGVAGQADSGTGVLAASTNGIALKVSGKAQFSRSGTASVAGTSAAPKNSVKVSLPITGKSLMTAVLQKYVAGVYVVAAVPNVSGGYFTIYLNKPVTTSVGPIAWEVVERR
jgi:hypothetical protein